MILANITEPTAGASTCASGNQTWKGIDGNLKHKPIKIKNHKNKPLKEIL